MSTNITASPSLRALRHQHTLTAVAYGSLFFAVLALLFGARTAWSIPFIVLWMLCTVFGHLSRTKGYIADISWLAFIFLFNTLLSSLFYIGDLQGRVAHIHQQQLTLVNQHLLIGYESTILQKQLVALKADQHQLTAGTKADKKTSQSWNDLVQNSTNDLQEIKSDLSDIKAYIAYTNYQLQQDSWQLPDSGKIDSNDNVLNYTTKEIQAVQFWIINAYEPQIALNNVILPDSEKVAYQRPTEQKSCPASYQCGFLPPWQQSFSDGWQRIGQPLEKTWQFWGALGLGLLISFIILPYGTRPIRRLSYRVISARSLSSYGPTSQQSMQFSTLPSTAILLHIGLKRLQTTIPRKRDYQQDEIIFEFSPGVTVLDGYTQINGVVRSTFHTPPSGSENIGEFRAGPRPGTVLFQPKNLISTGRAYNLGYTTYLFIALDRFDGQIRGTASLPDIDRFEQVRILPLLSGLSITTKLLALVMLYISSFFPLIICSHFFFDGLDFNQHFLFSTDFGLIIWSIGLWLASAGITALLDKALITTQTVALPAEGISGQG